MPNNADVSSDDDIVDVAREYLVPPHNPSKLAKIVAFFAALFCVAHVVVVGICVYYEMALHPVGGQSSALSRKMRGQGGGKRVVLPAASAESTTPRRSLTNLSDPKVCYAGEQAEVDAWHSFLSTVVERMLKEK